MSLREFARRMDVNESSIRKGIQTGRLEVSIAYDRSGRPYIRDVAEAEREWEENRFQ